MIRRNKTDTLRFATEMVNPEYKHVVEFGVCSGTTMGILRGAFDDSYSLFGFDSFVGLPEDWVSEDGTFICSKKRFDVGGKIPDIKGVTFYDGWFEDTLWDYLKVAEPIGLLHMDADLYSSTKFVLDNINDFIVKDTIIVFDEWFYNHDFNRTDHEQKAFLEFCETFNREYELINIEPVRDKRFEQQIVKITK
jgi:hypothetical protein